MERDETFLEWEAKKHFLNLEYNFQSIYLNEAKKENIAL